MTARLMAQLDLPRCPHCGVDSPTLAHQHNFQTINNEKTRKRHWAIYACQRCGGVVTASGEQMSGLMYECYPSPTSVDESLPGVPRAYLSQAIDCRHAPAGAVMLAASAVDAMLKECGYTDGSLYSRIDKAVKNHLITKEMGDWAHEVRLEANDQRHADQSAALPTTNDAERVVEFATALGEILFVLPARVRRGRKPAEA